MEQARTFARVATRLPVRVRVLDDTDREIIARRILTEPTYREDLPAMPAAPGEPGHFEQAALRSILARIEALEALVGRVAAAVGAPVDANEGWIEGEAVAASGAGLGLWLTAKLDEGAAIEVELTLMGEPRAHLSSIARVVSLVRPDGDRLPVGRFHVGAAFDTIHEADREALVRYTFRVQRAQLRDRRDGSPSL